MKKEEKIIYQNFMSEIISLVLIILKTGLKHMQTASLLLIQDNIQP
jgi:hypothetical protein